jgi:outer membrane murein-binding lipoprotein Lpp
VNSSGISGVTVKLTVTCSTGRVFAYPRVLGVLATEVRPLNVKSIVVARLSSKIESAATIKLAAKQNTVARRQTNVDLLESDIPTSMEESERESTKGRNHARVIVS